MNEPLIGAKGKPIKWRRKRVLVEGPVCDHPNKLVGNSRWIEREQLRYRRYKCPDCGERWSTVQPGENNPYQGNREEIPIEVWYEQQGMALSEETAERVEWRRKAVAEGRMERSATCVETRTVFIRGERTGPSKHPELYQGELHGRHVLTVADVRNIRRMWKNRVCTQREMALRYRVDKSTICAVIHRRSWSHVE